MMSWTWRYALSHSASLPTELQGIQYPSNSQPSLMIASGKPPCFRYCEISRNVKSFAPEAVAWSAVTRCAFVER